MDLTRFEVACLYWQNWIGQPVFATFSYSYLVILILVVAWMNLFGFSLFFSLDVLLALEMMVIVIGHTLIYTPILFIY